MSTMKGSMRRAILSGVVGGVAALATAGLARADVASDKPGAILVFPKIVVDTLGVLGPPTDTEIQITNASNSVVGAQCFLVDATSYCRNNSSIACSPEREAVAATRVCPPGDSCVAKWNEVDFQMILTKRQPVSWKVSEGRSQFPCDPSSNCGQGGGQSNGGSAVPPTADPFVGELKCVEVDPATQNPTVGFNAANRNAGDLKGEATIVSATVANQIDARKYNGIGIPSTGANNGDSALTLGPGASGEYSACPNVLILDHLFDDASVVSHRIGTTPVTTADVHTDLTVVPCSEDFNIADNNLGGATLQFLVFNEFEQRFSTSTNFSCFKEVRLSDIDTRVGPFGNAQSIFNVGVQGTLAGQTRIRPVEGSTLANGVLGIAEESWSCALGGSIRCSTAENLHFAGVNQSKGDLITLP